MAKVKDFLFGIDSDFDVYDDYTEELGIAWCEVGLTDDGMKEFSDVLEYEAEMLTEGWLGTRMIVHINSNKMLKKAKRFFESAAGYCSEEEWERWFKYID